MAFSEQTLEGFSKARAGATELLVEAGFKTRSVSFEEALVMQAIAHTLETRDIFYERDVTGLMRAIEAGIWVNSILRNFEGQYYLVTSSYERSEPPRRGKPPKVYAATLLGRTVFDLFNREEE